MRFMALLILISLGVFTGTSFAMQGAASDGVNWLDFARPVFDAVMKGQWWVAASAAVVLLCAVARRYMPDAWKTGVKGDVIGTATAFVMAFAAAIGTWGAAPGAVFSVAVIATAFKVGIAAIGGYTILHKVIGWLAGWGKLPAWVTMMLKGVSAIIGSNAIAKAEAAGVKAVTENPPTGMGIVKEVE